LKAVDEKKRVWDIVGRPIECHEVRIRSIEMDMNDDRNRCDR
jgi:hypothetical protein